MTGGAVTRNAATNDIISRVLNDNFAVSYAEKMLLERKSTLEHSMRVMHKALDIGQELELPDYQLFWLTEGGYFHDAGKLFVPAHLFDAPRPLTEDERTLMQDHPRKGYEYLWANGKKMAALFAMTHHEYQRKAYPRKQPREEHHLNDLFAIVALADSYDAMSMRRPYNPKFTKTEIYDIMAREYHGPEQPFEALVANF